MEFFLTGSLSQVSAYILKCESDSRQFNKEPGRAIFQILRNFLDISGHPMPDCDFCEQGLVLVLCRCQYGCIRQNTREPDVSCHCASVGVLEQRGRGGCRGYSGPATQHRGHQNRLPRALVTSSRGELSSDTGH